MGLNTWVRDLIRSKLLPFGGTISVPFDTDEFPTVIGNENLGGHHGYQTLEELASVPKLRLQRPMLATVLKHTRPGGEIFDRSTFVLDPDDSIWTPFLADPALTKISDIGGYNLSLYWKLLAGNVAQEVANLEYQYANEQDYGFGLTSPAFQVSTISDVNYQLGRKSDLDATVIWESTYNPSLHKYERQRIGASGKWGIPKNYWLIKLYTRRLC